MTNVSTAGRRQRPIGAANDGCMTLAELDLVGFLRRRHRHGKVDRETGFGRPEKPSRWFGS
jgi:hypothetical protein